MVLSSTFLFWPMLWSLEQMNFHPYCRRAPGTAHVMPELQFPDSEAGCTSASRAAVHTDTPKSPRDSSCVTRSNSTSCNLLLRLFYCWTRKLMRNKNFIPSAVKNCTALSVVPCIYSACSHSHYSRLVLQKAGYEGKRKDATSIITYTSCLCTLKGDACSLPCIF